MATTIITKHTTGSGAPTPDKVQVGELAIDLAGQQLYTKDNGGDIIKLGSGAGSGNIADGTAQGQTTIWNETDEEWQANDTLNVIGTNVGIGTDSPVATFQVGKEATEDAAIRVYNSSTVKTVSIDAGRQSNDVCGTEQKPSLIFNGDANTGIFHPAADTLSVSTNGTTRLTINAAGNVGIGSQSPSTSTRLYVHHSSNRPLTVDSSSSNSFATFTDPATTSIGHVKIGSEGDDLLLFSGGQERVRVDNLGNSTFNGKVGIGMFPLRQASEAKEQLEDWKSAIEERMKAEPKADRSAVTQEITGFDKLPTLEETKERLERAAGDKLQVNGNISAYGNATFHGGSSANRVSTTTSGTNAQITMGTQDGQTGRRCKLTFERGDNNFTFGNGNDGDNVRLTIASNGDATFSSTVDAAGFTVNGSPLTRVSDLIETLHTLREATKDESTLEGLRDAIGNAVGGLIEKFEAMQNSAVTQDIQESPVTQDIQE